MKKSRASMPIARFFHSSETKRFRVIGVVETVRNNVSNASHLRGFLKLSSLLNSCGVVRAVMYSPAATAPFFRERKVL